MRDYHLLISFLFQIYHLTILVLQRNIISLCFLRLKCEFNATFVEILSHNEKKYRKTVY